jgi:fused signal recognition particle receptor
VFTKRRLDQALLEELEEQLIESDLGPEAAARVAEAFGRGRFGKDLTEPEIREALAEAIAAELRPHEGRFAPLAGPKPFVVLFVGVNGSGKTTTLGKVAADLRMRGAKVLIAAGDTFRAAATEQLDVWAERGKAELVKGPEGGDPGSVVFDAVKKAVEQKADVVIADTAGRLHTKAPLMEELKKVKRVMGKALPGAPHEVLLVLDSTNGQNAIQQAKQFHEVVGITGIALTKLDGTAKGGVIIGICDELKIPVLWVGVGEKVADLRRFDPKEFVPALFD